MPDHHRKGRRLQSHDMQESLVQGKLICDRRGSVVVRVFALQSVDLDLILLQSRTKEFMKGILTFSAFDALQKGNVVKKSWQASFTLSLDEALNEILPSLCG